MTAAEVQRWLSSRTPAPPTELAQRLSSLLTACPPDRLTALSSLPAALGALGTFTLDSLHGRDPMSRDVAMDLLAADAFVTYAFEAASELPDGRADAVAAALLEGVRA